MSTESKPTSVLHSSGAVKQWPAISLQGDSSPKPPPEYRTIVVDPPWDHSDGIGADLRPETKHVYELPYPVLSVPSIAALPVDALAELDAHLYLWTTNRYLRVAYDIAHEWGFSVVKPLVWCKKPKGLGFGGSYKSNVEFVLFCRRGREVAHGTSDRQWFCWPRRYRGTNKPEAFLDLVESVSPGPYLELFARRNRLGWHTWGNESLEHVEVVA